MTKFLVKTLICRLKYSFLIGILFICGCSVSTNNISRGSIQANNLILSASLMDIFLMPSLSASSIQQEIIKVTLSGQQIYTKQINYDSSGLIKELLAERIPLEEKEDNLSLLMMPNHFKLEQSGRQFSWLSRVENDDVYLIRYDDHFVTNKDNNIEHVVRNVKPSENQNMFRERPSIRLTFGIDDRIIRIIDQSLKNIRRTTSFRYNNKGDIVKTVFVMQAESNLREERFIDYRYDDNQQLIEIRIQTTQDTGYNAKYVSSIMSLKPVEYNDKGDWITFLSEDGQLKLERIVSYY